MGFEQVLAVGALALEQVGNGVEPQAVDAAIQPETQHVEHGLADARVVEVQVWLVAEEAVPVVAPRLAVPGPVRRLGIGEDDPCVAVALVGVAPDVVVVRGRLGVGARLLEPGVLIRGVVHDQLGDDPQSVPMGGGDELLEVLEDAVGRVDGEVVADVVAVVALGRREGGQQPDGGDAEILNVVELLDQAAEVADPVGVAVEEGFDVRPHTGSRPCTRVDPGCQGSRWTHGVRR